MYIDKYIFLLFGTYFFKINSRASRARWCRAFAGPRREKKVV